MKPFTLKHFAAWLADQSGEYNYWDCFTCPIAQYGIEHGMEGGADAYGGIKLRFNLESDMPLVNIVQPHPWAFEAAAARAKEQL